MLCPGSSAPQSPLDEVDGLGWSCRVMTNWYGVKQITVVILGKIAKLGKRQIKLLDMWMDIDQFSPDLGSCRYMKSSFYVKNPFYELTYHFRAASGSFSFSNVYHPWKKARMRFMLVKSSNLPGPRALRHPFWTGTLGTCLRDVSLVRSEGRSFQMWNKYQVGFLLKSFFEQI